jgi:hypothetical protein
MGRTDPLNPSIEEVRCKPTFRSLEYLADFAHNMPFRHAFVAKLEARDAHIRESWINAMEAKLVGEELSKCRKGEGVNSYQNCKYLADLYLELLKDASVSIRILYLSF